jgi:hypothetical protein
MYKRTVLNIAKSSAFYFALFLMLSAVFGCSPSSPPSPADALNLLEKQIQSQSGGIIKLVSFSKTDGIAKEIDGTKCYEMKYNAEIEFTQDCYWGPMNYTGTWTGDFFASDIASLPKKYEGHAKNMERVTKGKKIKLASSLDFQKTEKGWGLQ